MRTPVKVAVTGATGFLGSHLTERLIDEHCRVNILARDPNKARRFEGRVAEIIYGDITDEQALAQLVAGCDTVVHLVSNFRTVGGSPESYFATNVHGTERLLRVAEDCGVGRFVHCSTIGVHGHVEHTPAVEESPYNPGDLYQETKMQAELICQRVTGASEMEIVIVRPTSQYGPGDLRMLKMFKLLRRGRFVLIGRCAENFHAVYIDDLVEGFWKVMTVDGISGEIFLIGGPGYVPLQRYIEIAAEAVNAPPPRIRLPYSPVFLTAWLCELLCKPFGVEPPLHRRRVKFFKNNRAFSIDKARNRLGYQAQVDLKEGMRRTVDWYRQQGWI